MEKGRKEQSAICRESSWGFVFLHAEKKTISLLLLLNMFGRETRKYGVSNMQLLGQQLVKEERNRGAQCIMGNPSAV